ncbi:type II CAAX prenyl endopeptidase Rce1 family protein [Deinococcus multiflagellatus]|uniref:Type II CAAX prenyl endopeptidase Rce1 family protein n=1 Tax=Deinococcus multiflagellatus TaxID=1656887 RepID=A0ABW1ZQ89_9DEIO|nr:CPBP family glutamic-type intramembrane protease [Deinococcus multiflagellatus]MBZ9715631.1 CPBP family intramembrane metalloprotease [Deinococcus multiflagellatus]
MTEPVLLRWPLPPSRLTVRGAGLLALLVMVSLTVEAWIHFEVVEPWLREVTGAEAFKREASQLPLSWQRFESIVIAPLMEESAYRAAFSASLMPLLAAASAPGRRRVVESTVATVLLILIGFASFFFGAGHLLSGWSVAGVCYLLSLLVTAPVLVCHVRGRPVPRALWIVAAVVTTLAFAVMHLDNYVALPSDPRVALLTVPQLLGGGIFLFAAGRYGLRAAMLAHMTSNGLLAVPWFVSWLHWVLATV